MKNEIMKDITEYIDFLRDCGYSVTLSCFSPVFSSFLPILYRYEVHLSPFCFCMKSSPKTMRKCIENKKCLVKSGITQPYYGCCYAGVEEYVIPVTHCGQILIYINVSGYRGALPKSERRFGKIKKYCSGKAEKYYALLSTQIPEEDRLMRAVRPLFYMFRSLADECVRNPSDIPYKEAIYRNALAFIYDNYMNNITCADVSEAVAYSESYVRTLFKECGGKSIAKTITEIRLEHACTLLRTTAMSVEKIAFDLGFNDANYFSTVFKKFYGQSPREYRKNPFEI